MTKKPLIGITAGEVTNVYGKWAPLTYGQSYTYVDAIIHAGGIPMILPITSDKLIWKELFERCDGILFSGGNDIDPSFYGQKKSPKTKDVSKLRDTQESALLHLTLEADKPLLAICRGMQLLNVTHGGTLHQHLPDDVPNSADHEASTTEKDTKYRAHTLLLERDSKLYGILGSHHMPANSHHHQGVDAVGSGLVVSAHAEDGVIEGLERPDKRFVVGVQSHPESLESEAVPAWSKLFKAFVAAAAGKG